MVRKPLNDWPDSSASRVRNEGSVEGNTEGEMKILMVNTEFALHLSGGDLTQMRKTAEALRPYGVTVSEAFGKELNPAGHDLVHIFNLRNVEEVRLQVSTLRKSGVPIVMSPIYLDPSYALWGTRVVSHIFGSPAARRELDNILDEFASRQLHVERENGDLWTADGKNRPQPDYDQLQREAVDAVDHLLPNSVMEMDRLAENLRIDDKPFTVVPYAADPDPFLDPDPTPFVDRYGLDNFVIQVGRIEKSKNQIMLVHALRQLDIPIVLIGSNRQAAYLRLCQELGGAKVHVIDHMPAQELASAYAAAKVHALPSWVETCGLTTMEAALGDCNVVCSTAGYESEFFQSFPYYCDPSDVKSIRDSVQQALENYDDDAPRRAALKRRIRKEFTWERAAEKTFQAYQGVLASR